MVGLAACGGGGGGAKKSISGNTIDTVQAAALLIQMKADGCKSLHIWNSKTTYSAGLAKDVTLEAPKTGLKIEGNDGYDIKAANYRALAANIHSDCFLSTGEIE